MKDKRTLLIVTFALLISVVTSAYISYSRIKIEKEDNCVELTADYSDIERMASFEKVNIPEVLSRLKDAGITSVALTEDLAGSVDMNFVAGVDPKKLNLYIPSRGLSQNKIKEINGAGLRVIPRIRNAFSLNGRSIAGKIKDLSGFGMVIFAEEEVLGYPNYLKETAKAIKSYNLRYGFVEFGKQLGDSVLSSYLAGNILKVHSIPPDEMENLTREEIIKRYLRAARERSIRILYVHLLSYPDNGKSLGQTNIEFIDDIKRELQAGGLVTGKASSPERIKVNAIARGLIAIGIAGGLLLLINYFVQPSFPVSFAILALFALIPSAKILALASAIIFPAYAVISQFPLKREQSQYGIISRSVLITMSIAGITAVGSMIIASLLADKVHMLGVEGFSGVKMAFILPVIVVVSYFFFRNEDGMLDVRSALPKLYDLLRVNVTIFHVLLFLMFSAAATLLILRSGNFGVPVPGFEKSARGLLENMLFIRPRTKEFLIGYPALLLAAIYYLKGRNKWLWLWAAFGVLAPISMINSFCHIHTPLIISLIRSCVGLILGIALGLLLFFAWSLASRFKITNK